MHMLHRLRSLWPSKLRNRIFIAFIFVVFVPFSYIQMRNYNQIQTMIDEKISEQNAGQLDYMARVLEDAKMNAQISVLQMEQDERFREAFRSTLEMPVNERHAFIQEKIVYVRNQYLPQSPYIHYTVLDRYGQVFTSGSHPVVKEHVEGIDIQFEQNLRPGEQWKWMLLPATDWLKEVAGSGPLLTLYSKTSDSEQILIRVSIDINAWLRDTANVLQVKQNYYLLDDTGKAVTQAASGFVIEPQLIPELLQYGKHSPQDYVLDSTHSYVFNAVYLTGLKWYVVSQFPLDFFFGDIEAMKRRVFLEFSLITVFFVAVAFLTLSTLTKPLRLLERRMREAKEKRLNIKIPETGHRGEILSFVRTFNDMIDNVSQLIGQLKMEERQKESLRFQMLLSQMNPHFLLNTLNTIKWNAWNAGDKSTAEMCKALGKLLESSLNTDTDMVYLKDEMELMKAYIYIQTFRFDNAFEAVYECAPELDYALVPKLSLQPLAENAIEHGLVHRKKGGIISIKGYRDDNRLVMEIRDNGVGIGHAPPAKKRKRKGIGINNLKERIALLFRDEGKLELIPLEEGTMARMTIPLLLSNPYHEPDNPDTPGDPDIPDHPDDQE